MKQLAVGIDIGGTNTEFGLVDREGNIHGKGAIKTMAYPDIKSYLEELSIGINALCKKVDGGCEIIGIGIGAPMANYLKGTIENASNLMIEGTWAKDAADEKGIVHFVDKMKNYFPSIPILLTNDANAAAIGEMMYGAAKYPDGRPMQNFIVITLGTGLGSGFVAGGELVYGHDGFAGELGHVVVNHTGRVCGCGRKGCLETYVSATGIKRTIFKLLADHNPAEASEFRDKSFNTLEAKDITAAALNGDALAQEAFEYTGMMLGRALADAVAVTSPEAIFLFGGLAKAGRHILEPTQKYMDMNMLFVFRNKVKVQLSGIKDDESAAVLGASALIWKQVEA